MSKNKHKPAPVTTEEAAPEAMIEAPPETEEAAPDTLRPEPEVFARPQDANPAWRSLHTFSDATVARFRTQGLLP